MKSRFDYDFSKVKIHTDETAVRSANSVKARAYTVGSDIIFGKGQYQPGTLQGRRLLAHELAHVVQQSKSGGNIMKSDSVKQHEHAAIAHKVI